MKRRTGLNLLAAYILLSLRIDLPHDIVVRYLRLYKMGGESVMENKDSKTASASVKNENAVKLENVTFHFVFEESTKPKK